MGVTCWKCEAAWDHCHGTVIRHSLRHTECTQSDCAGPELIPHALVIDCDVVGCDCGQPIGSAGGAVALESSG